MVSGIWYFLAGNIIFSPYRSIFTQWGALVTFVLRHSVWFASRLLRGQLSTFKLFTRSLIYIAILRLKTICLLINSSYYFVKKYFLILLIWISNGYIFLKINFIKMELFEPFCGYTLRMLFFTDIVQHFYIKKKCTLAQNI